jgi:GNAT superfamily N-acetyltransferase
VQALYPRDARWALWTAQQETAEVALAAGLIRDTATTAMMCTLEQLPAAPPFAVGVDSDPRRVAVINGLPPEMVTGVRGVRAFVTDDDTSGLLMFTHDQDVNLGFVATVERARGRGLATGVVLAALHEAALAGARTATLQATASAVGLYARIGFVPIGEWQEWTGPDSPLKG